MCDASMIATQLVTLLGRQVVGHDDAAQVVRLVLQAPGERSCARNSDRIATIVRASENFRPGLPVGRGSIPSIDDH
jgi:hypothetical protein